MIRKRTFEIPTQGLEELCRRWQITELSLFGSAVRGDFGSASDVDLLATFDDEAHWTLLDVADLQEELSALFGCAADVVTRRSIEQSKNEIRRRAILDSAEPIYVAG